LISLYRLTGPANRYSDALIMTSPVSGYRQDLRSLCGRRR